MNRKSPGTKCGRDGGLQTRMLPTMFLLGLVYAVLGRSRRDHSLGDRRLAAGEAVPHAARSRPSQPIRKSVWRRVSPQHDSFRMPAATIRALEDLA